jgi:NitT/TauT family transport system substrate-binding protein
MKTTLSCVASAVRHVLALSALAGTALFAADAPALVAAKTAVPTLPPLTAYEPTDNTVAVELSQYAGYAGLVAINGGLDPNADSIFTKRFGFKLKLTLSEEESWPALNQGRIAASATTTDVLAVYGRQFQVTVPALIGYSRGADALVSLSEAKSIKDLKGRLVITSQFTEADFFVRYLANEGGLGVAIASEGRPLDPEKINLIYAGDAFAAGDLFLADVQSGRNRYAACVTWEPKTTDVVQGSGGKAHVLASNRNILVIADILVVNKGFEKKRPELVRGLVEGLLEGNRMVRGDPAAYLTVVGKAFGWDARQTRAELSKVHLANLPENLGFFQGDMVAGGSFDYIFQAANESYGTAFIPRPADPDFFKNLKYLKDIDRAGTFKNEVAEITPLILEAMNPVETTPIDKDLRFLFPPNEAKLDLNDKNNKKYLDSLAGLLRAGVGSRIVLSGHVEGSQIPKFKAQGNEASFKQVELAAVSLSKNRARAVKDALVDRYNIDAERIETTGRGWNEPLGGPIDFDRRVQAQWITVN